MPLPEKVSGKLIKGKVRYGGSEILAGLKVWRIESIPAEGDRSSHIWWIAAERDGLIIKHERRSLLVDAQSGVESWRHVHIVDEIRRENGILVPVKVRFIIFITPRGKTEMWERLEKVTATSLSINTPIVDTTFGLPFPIKTQVNVIANRGYTVKENIKSFEPTFDLAVEKKAWKLDQNDLTGEPPASLSFITKR